MKFALVPVNVGVRAPDQVIGLAQLAETTGYESVWTFEHVIVPVDYQSKYPYDKSGKMGATPETNFVDPLIALTAIAANTKTIRLGTGVNIVAQTNPLLLAKQVASLDFMSGGRFMLGAGIGWLQEEFIAMGTPYEKRGARFDDYMVALRKAWSGDVVEHKSEYVNWTGFKTYPTPVQDPLPIIMGGNAGKILERTAKYGEGWFIPAADPKDIVPRLEELKKVCKEVGRDYDSIELTCMWPARGGLESVKALEDIGIERLVTPLPALGENPVEGIQRLADEVIQKAA